MMSYLLLQAEVIGDAVGKGIVELILTIVGILAAIVGFGLFLLLVRKIDKKLNK